MEGYFNFFSHLGWFGLIFFLSPLVISIIFLRKDQNKSKFTHYAVSFHGSLIVAVFFFSWIINFLEYSNDNWLIFLGFVMFLAAGSVIFSFLKFTGNKKYHFLHVVTLAVAPYLWFLATMFFTDRWL